MSKINLLPWREEKRKELQTQFIMALMAVAVFAAVIFGAWHFYYVQLIDVQNTRIVFIEESIKVVDKKIEQIKELEQEKERLLSRMRAIEQLQGNRPLIVHLFDELITSMPDGVTVTSFIQKGSGITINGVAQSNARVSSFMRNLEISEWLASPNLKVIKATNREGVDISNFTLSFKQVTPKAKEGEDE